MFNVNVNKQRNQKVWIDENGVVIDQNTPHGISTMRNIMKIQNQAGNEGDLGLVTACHQITKVTDSSGDDAQVTKDMALALPTCKMTKGKVTVTVDNRYIDKYQHDGWTLTG